MAGALSDPRFAQCSFKTCGEANGGLEELLHLQCRAHLGADELVDERLAHTSLDSRRHRSCRGTSLAELVAAADAGLDDAAWRALSAG
jgi:hypothetical protein